MKEEEIYNSFIAKCDDELSLFQKAAAIYSGKLLDEKVYSKEFVYRYAESSFLNIFCIWEEFLESSFIGYMLGCSTRSGNTILSFSTPKDEEHARSIIRSTNRFLEWNDIEKVYIYAQNLFENAGPYATLITMKQTLGSIKKIRNAIAHNSDTSKREFENVVRSTVGRLPEDMTVGRYLVDFSHHSDRKHTFFEYYIQYLKDTADMLTDWKPEEKNEE